MESLQEGLSAIKAAELLGIAERTFHGLRGRPGFPPPAYLTPKTLRWSRTELLAWFNAQPRAALKPEPEQLQRGRIYRAGQEAQR